VKPNYVITDGNTLAVGLYYAPDVMSAPVVVALCIDDTSTQPFLTMCESEEVYTAYAPQFIHEAIHRVALGLEIPVGCYEQIVKIVVKGTQYYEAKQIDEKQSGKSPSSLESSSRNTFLQQFFCEPAIQQYFLQVDLALYRNTSLVFDFNMYKRVARSALKKAAVVEEGLHAFRVLEENLKVSKEFWAHYHKIAESWIIENAYFLETKQQKPKLQLIV
jgi:type III secretion system FlhB-like substrate exporter